jgi:hypothetical protein
MSLPRAKDGIADTREAVLDSAEVPHARLPVSGTEPPLDGTDVPGADLLLEE